MLESILQNQADMMQLLKTIAERPASFTAEDRTSLSQVLQNKYAHTTSLDGIASNVRTLVVHALPPDNLEGERCAKELADEIIGKVNETTPGTPISPYIQQQPIPTKTIVADVEEEEDDEDEEDDDEEIPHYGGDNDDDDDEASKFFTESRPGNFMHEIFFNEPLGDGPPPSHGQFDPSGKNKQVVFLDSMPAHSEGEIAAE